MLQVTQLTFDDLILLNPSVEPEDETRLSGQAQRILQLFVTARRDSRLVANVELISIAAQYNARLFEVRRFLVKHGFCIDLLRRDRGGICWYGMVPIDESTFYQQHCYSF